MNVEELTIVITTFHSQEKIYNCLESIDKKIKVIIVENTNDYSLKENLRKKYNNVEIILSSENLGYAKGNNLGLTKVKSKYALIINPDVVIDNNTIKNFFILSEKIHNFAIIGPEIQDEKNYLKKNIDKNSRFYEVNNVKGFAMFLKLSEFREVGFFDENFFIYLEETDLCLRLKKNGKKIFVSSDIRFLHSGFILQSPYLTMAILLISEITKEFLQVLQAESIM